MGMKKKIVAKLSRKQYTPKLKISRHQISMNTNSKSDTSMIYNVASDYICIQMLTLDREKSSHYIIFLLSFIYLFIFTIILLSDVYGNVQSEEMLVLVKVLLWKLYNFAKIFQKHKNKKKRNLKEKI